MSRGNPIRVLNVAEKPSVAKSVAGILSKNHGGLRTREGRSRYNKIFEFSYVINGQQCHMLFTSVIGHLMELKFDDRYRKWYSCDPLDLYQAPVSKYVPEDKLDIKKTLEEEARKCQWLVLWLDCDREGENIAFEVVEVCVAANRHLNIWRARFSALIDREIYESMQQLVRPNQLFSDAVDVRQEIDLRIGASFTRFQTMLLRDAFHLEFNDDRNVVISYGPCQFPTLGFVVERYWEMQGHEPEEFWSINCTHKSAEGSATFNWMRGHLFDYTCALIIYEMCVQEPTATVTEVTESRKMKYPPHPLSTIELEKRAARYFRMSSARTMEVADELYHSGFLSYPRTETDGFSPRTDLRAIVQEQQGHPVWGSYAQRLLDPEGGLWRNPVSGGHDDKAHPPIHPTKFSSGESGWSQDHQRVYELVVRHFLACVSQPAVGAETKVEIDIVGELFYASGRVVLEKNYLEVYRFDSWGGSLVPVYTPGQQFVPTTLTLDSGVTRPPLLLSEEDLLNLMDKAGIGTDATMHDHIKKLLDRSYAVKDSNMRFSPTNLGEALVMGYDEMGYELWKPYLRAMMESDMKAVSLGTKRKEEVLTNVLQQMKDCFLDARSKKEKLFEAMGVFFDRSNRPNGVDQNSGGVVCRCSVCHGSDMMLKQRMDGNFMVGCQSYPQCRNVVWLPGSIAEATITTNVCSNCTPGPVFKVQFKFKQLEIPPNYDINHLGCIGGCDEILKQLTEICGTNSRNQSNSSGRGRGTTSSTNQQNNSRFLCENCSQSGHSSSSCPYQASSTRRGAHSQGTNQQTGEISIPCETCATPCTLRTANTANNRGRKFYSCQSQGCNFFVWEDSLNNSTGARTSVGNTSSRNNNNNNNNNNSNSNSNSSSRRGRGGGSGTGRGRGRGRNRNDGEHGNEAAATFVLATGEPITDRRCFVCGDPSHFANACPSRRM
ncbi:DNA topoisomerase 3-alpha [Impatiens glandulifera]|uniref:DNA topoisomerase 3-alpha n=1 Tax=Impatiens glandulifera TaxID=253017 RepID=UPI001FB0DF29|nr:DNA topoisomerase 3-alpha [Impatiens glandulifera]